jgi:hypothetical protein
MVSDFYPLAAANDFLIDRVASVPQLFRDKLREIIRPGNNPMPIAMRDAGELIYAWREQLPPEMIEIGVAMIGNLIMFRQFGYQEGRGAAILATFAGNEPNPPEAQRELTEEGLTPAPEAPPAPISELPPPEVAEPDEGAVA